MTLAKRRSEFFKRAGGFAAAALAAALLWSGACLAAPDAPADDGQPTPSPESQLRGVEDTISISQEQRRAIEAEIQSIKADQSRLTAALIDATARVQEAERQEAAASDRLENLTATAKSLESSLEGRKALVADVLAALQRMGRNPPPAILMRPNDVASAIRAAMTLGAIIPELRAETEALAKDLERLAALRAEAADERDNAAKRAAELAEERVRLTALMEVRRQSLAGAEDALAAERARAAELAKQAATLKDLIARSEEQSRATAAAQADADSIAAKAASLRAADPARLKPAVAFVDAKGALPLPVTGVVVRNFGANDGYGGLEKGISIATKPGAVVASPMDGAVAFSGPYRSYGQLLILNAGGGYYMVMAGLGRVAVSPGQFVLAGEPLAVMGDGATRTAAAAAVGVNEPILYIELRKDGVPVDPGPWWAKADNEKARG